MNTLKYKKQEKVLIVAYYLSKFNYEALNKLNYKTHREAFNDIGERLEVKPNTLKNRRDDFDSINDNGRKGWYQKELSKRHLNIVEKYGEISEDGLLEIVKDLIYLSTEDYEDIIEILNEEELNNKNFRGITGKKAEEIFMEYFNSGRFLNYQGHLIDTRNDGCGFDFKLEGEAPQVFEVKGLSSVSGGISFTDKEWRVAKQLQEKYTLVIINEVFREPSLKYINNPYQKLNPTKAIQKVISINWNVTWNDFNSNL